MNRPIYLDYNATTPVDPRVLEDMLPYLGEHFGNASSAHPYGYDARAAVSRAREQVARLIGARPDEVVFTGGGSESNNLALKGVVFSRLGQKQHLIAGAAEHPAVLNTLAYLAGRFGIEITRVPVDEYGRVDAARVEAAIRPHTVLISVMQANNEVGTLQPVEEIGRIARRADVLFHVDAAQAAGKVQIDVNAIGADLLSVVGHKLYAPKGVGALYIRRGTALDPLIHGSGQEHGLRAGTENVAGMVALGAAAELVASDLRDETARLTGMRDRLESLLRASIEGLLLNGHPLYRLPNTLNVSFPSVLGQALLAAAPDVAASTGAACHSDSPEPSAVLLAMGLPVERALGAVRLSVGRMTREDEVERAAEVLVAAHRTLVGQVFVPAH